MGRPKLSQKVYLDLVKKNDTIAFTHLVIHCVCILATGLLCSYFYLKHLYVLFIITLLVHGTIYTFLGWEGASHELIHNSVFKSRSINRSLLYIFSFMTWNNHVYFSESHKRHHLFTLHTDKDCEYNFSYSPSRLNLIWELTFNLPSFTRRLRILIENSFGSIRGYWPNALFQDKVKKEKMLNNSRMILTIHLLLVIIFVYFKWYHLVFVITLAPFFGNYLPRSLGRLQHLGLQYNTLDFTECCRTVIVHPVVEFFYWGMNYHLEHHIYPTIPFYNLKNFRMLLQEQSYLSHD